jgi:hypothetical protein
MRCDHCEELLPYRAETVVVYEEGGARRARLVMEDSPGLGEAASLKATAKFHPSCYEDARRADPLLPPVETDS